MTEILTCTTGNSTIYTNKPCPTIPPDLSLSVPSATFSAVPASLHAQEPSFLLLKCPSPSAGTCQEIHAWNSSLIPDYTCTYKHTLHCSLLTTMAFNLLFMLFLASCKYKHHTISTSALSSTDYEGYTQCHTCVLLQVSARASCSFCSNTYHDIAYQLAVNLYAYIPADPYVPFDALACLTSVPQYLSTES